ncbi:hypothetical protein KM043_012024 [Ampulex compressa]|nr:hypothetical protein KM043_012024 [Ampulex compressa]
MMEIKNVYVKTRAEFGKQCIFDTWGPNMDEEIRPNPEEMKDYILRTHCHVGAQHSRQLALHEAQTEGTTTRNSGMFHFEGGWPREINPKDEEATARFRRRVEKDDDWAPKLRGLLEMAEHSVLQNGAINIYEHYFDDMIPTELVKPVDLRTANVYADPETPPRPVNDISWSPDSGSKMVVSYCFLDFGKLPDYSNTAYIWQIDNPNAPYIGLETFCPSVVSEFNPRDPSVLASGLMSGQVCSWDIRTGTSPVQLSHRQFGHRYPTNGVKWLPTKSNTEFFSTSTDGQAIWWDTRKLKGPTELLVFDLQTPNQPSIDRAIGVSSLDFGPMVGTQFMFGMENGIVISGSRKSRTNAEKLALRFNAHYGPVVSVDRNVFSPKIFMTVGDWTSRIWALDTKEANLVSTEFLQEQPSGGCWNKSRHSVFYVITRTGFLTAWDLLQGLQEPILRIQLSKDGLTTIAPHENGAFLAIGNSAGRVFLVESTESLRSFEKNEKNNLSAYLERCSRFVKAADTRLKEIKLAKSREKEEEAEAVSKEQKATKRSKNESRQGQSTRPSRKSVHRDKKRLKDDSPELAEAEERYFAIVEKMRQMYEMDDELSMKSSASASARRLDDRKTDRRRQAAGESRQEDEADKSPREKKTKAPRVKRIQEQPILEEEKPIEQSPRPLIKPVTHEVPPATKEIPKKTKKKTKRRKRKPRAPRSRRPCKVCRPAICCRKPDSWRKLEETRGKRSRIGQPGVSRVGRNGTIKRSKDEERLAGRVSRVRLDKRRGGRKVGGTKERMAAPTVLEKEVTRAKREIREAKMLTGKMRTRYIFLKILENRSRKVRGQGKGGGAEKSKGDRRYLEGQEASSKALEASQMGKMKPRATRRRKSAPKAAPDPCTPRKPMSVMRELEALLSGPMRKPIEDKPGGKPYFEEIGAAQARVYPRISEFHSIE